VPLTRRLPPDRELELALTDECVAMSEPACSLQPTASSSHSMVRSLDDLSSACFLCHCGMVYTNPKPVPGSIDYTEDNHPETFYSFPADFKASWMARYCPPGRLLEVGSGHGSLLAACRARGYEVSGLEPHPSRARYVEETLGIKVEQAFLEENRLPPGSFDIVSHCDMLAHFPDPVVSLHRMSALLRPGGVLFLEVGILGGISPLRHSPVPIS
jgi:SAM-dependent methyltransferase